MNIRKKILRWLGAEPAVEQNIVLDIAKMALPLILGFVQKKTADAATHATEHRIAGVDARITALEDDLVQALLLTTSEPSPAVASFAERALADAAPGPPPPAGSLTIDDLGVLGTSAATRAGLKAIAGTMCCGGTTLPVTFARAVTRHQAFDALRSMKRIIDTAAAAATPPAATS